MDADQLRQYLEFYQDLGIKTIYRRATPVSAPDVAVAEELPVQVVQPIAAMPKVIPPPPLAEMPAEDSMFKILEDIGDCRRCRLHEARNKIVFGVGDEKA